MKINDSKLPPDIIKEKKKTTFIVEEPQAEQKDKDSPDQLWQKIFQNLRNLLGDQEVKKMTAT